jgi:acetyl esterase
VAGRRAADPGILKAPLPPRMTLDPHVQRFLEKLTALGSHRTQRLSVEERRQGLAHMLEFAGQRQRVGPIEERTLPGPVGPLRVRIYSPAGAHVDPLPPFIYFHGGGLVAGNLDTHDGICRSLANACACRLISIEYRVAPEHPFPAAIEDALAAARWVAAHAVQLRANPDRLVIGGDSAGATLAAVLCQMLAASGEIRPALQFLLCPITAVRVDTDSRRRFAEGYLLDAATLEQDVRHYLPPGADPSDPRVSPLWARELRGVPPACIHTAEFDPARDEGRAYAERLQAAGVRTLYRCHSGMIHLFYGLGSLVPYTAAAYPMIGADVRSMLA